MLTNLWTIMLWTASLLSVVHVLLYKRDPRAQLGWIVVCLGLPGLGAFFYWLLGVNRIRSRARGWQMDRDLALNETRQLEKSYGIHLGDPSIPRRFNGLYRLANRVTRRPLLRGNRLQVLYNGEEAFPAMREAIEGARHSIELATYIFENNTSGRELAEALVAAADRGVQVRVLVDGLGALYSIPTIAKALQHPQLRYARFLPLSLGGRGLYLNLRNHGKILVVDHRVGFTGGMNLGDRHLVSNPSVRNRVADLHFKVEGPVLGHLRQAFAENWYFATSERLPESGFLPEACGDALCRGISAGPDEGFEKLHWILIGALHCARERVQIMTPYFIPDRAMISALTAAAHRGVRVEIVLPKKNNLPFVHWATRSYLWELLQHGVRIYYQPPPFVHSKYLLVDGALAVIGSANLDPRSLRLNFEFNLGVYEEALTKELGEHFDQVLECAAMVTLADMDARPLTEKLRDSFFKLFSPYL